MVIVLGLLVLSILLIVIYECARRSNFRSRFDYTNVLLCLFSLSLFLSFAGGLIFLISYTANLDTNAELRTFHNVTFSVYKMVAERTEKMIVGSGGKDGNLSVILKTEHLQQAPQAAARWAELRAKVEWYNYTLNSKKAFYGNWFLRQWMPEPPMELPNIRLE